MALEVIAGVALKKKLLRDWRRRFEVMSSLLLITTLVAGGCSSRGPVPVEGVVTGKHQISSRGNQSQNSEKERPRYFLWVKEEEGLAFAEVTEDVFQSVAEGDRVCINCNGHAVVSKAAGQSTVKRDEVPVYAQMTDRSEVVKLLERGAVVTVGFAAYRPEGAWCYVRMVGGVGFVRCADLDRELPTAAAPPTVTGRPKEEVPPVAAIPPETPPKSPKPAETPANPETLTRQEKPTPQQLAKVAKPSVKPKVEYSIQVASLVQEKNALSLKQRLEKLRYTPVIRMATVPITRHRVYGGEFSSREQAERTARRLNVDGFPSNLVEIEGGTFRLEVGSFFDLKKATNLAQALEKKNYPPKIDSKTAPTPVHRVRVGEYQNRAEAQKAVEALKKEGFTPLIVKQ